MISNVVNAAAKGQPLGQQAMDYRGRPRLLYSPGLAPRGLWLFPRVERIIKAKGFEWIRDVEAAIAA